jgi:hypothetical protein
MTHAELEALGRRAVACKRWRWMPGMRVVTEMGDAFRVEDVDFCSSELNWPKPHALLLPNLSDPATLGCLLALVREAYGQPTMSCLFDHADAAWSEYPWDAKLVGIRVVIGGCGRTEAGALVSALEGAP